MLSKSLRRSPSPFLHHAIEALSFYILLTLDSGSIEDRIVSINQPHIRPIVRGKSGNKVEFGSKLSISVVDGYSYLDYLSWNNFNERSILIDQINEYRRKFGCYPEKIDADKIYRNRKNRQICKNLGIKLSGPPLGRPRKDIVIEDFKEGDRNPVEGKFGEGKRKYGLGNIMDKLPETSESMISMIFIVMNMKKIMREYYFVFVKFLIFF